MDIKAIGGKLVEFVKKYRYVLLVLLLGIAFMVFPGQSSGKEQIQAAVKENTALEDQTQHLEEVLEQIRGAGKVTVLLTYAAGEKTIYQSDMDTSVSDSSSSTHGETIIVSDADRSEQGLVTQVLPPDYLGAVIVCQGADEPSVRLAIVDAVSKATGLGADRISVLKMK